MKILFVHKMVGPMTALTPSRVGRSTENEQKELAFHSAAGNH